jgi:hypothetical protein
MQSNAKVISLQNDSAYTGFRNSNATNVRHDKMLYTTRVDKGVWYVPMQKGRSVMRGQAQSLVSVLLGSSLWSGYSAGRCSTVGWCSDRGLAIAPRPAAR